MKSLFLFCLLAIGMAIPARAGLVTAFGNATGTSVTLNGGTNRLIATTNGVAAVTNSFGGTPGITNTFGSPSSGTGLVVPVIDHDYCGYTFSFTGCTNCVLQVYESFDMTNSFPPYAAFSLSGSGTFYTNGVWDIHGATHLGFQIISTGTIDASNLNLSLYLKDSKVLTKPGW